MHQSVFVNEVEGLSPEFPVLLEDDRALGDVNITIETVYKELMNLNPHKAAGPDGIKHIVLKSCAKSLALPLHIMFRKTVDQRRLPNEWKTAKITALFKKGSRKANNYRPVSLTSQICKVMEQIIREQVTEHLEHNSLMSKHQHQAWAYYPEVMSDEPVGNLRRLGGSTGYTPWIRCGVSRLRKAFDTVPDKRLIKKLKGYGITGKIADWIQDFLKDHQQQVCVGKGLSRWGQAKSGVPQGSVLGPMLFLLYVNEVPSLVQSSIKLFADDTKIY